MGRSLDDILGIPCADKMPAGDGDCCRPAVLRAYREMHASGAPDAHCLDVAHAVYRWHHPEASMPDAIATVGLWVNAGQARH